MYVMADIVFSTLEPLYTHMNAERSKILSTDNNSDDCQKLFAAILGTISLVLSKKPLSLDHPTELHLTQPLLIEKVKTYLDPSTQNFGEAFFALLSGAALFALFRGGSSTLSSANNIAIPYKGDRYLKLSHEHLG